MGKMNVSFEIEFGPDELAGLAETIGCKPDEVEGKIGGYAAAALREYADMMIGERLLASVTEVRERRLVGLIQYTLKSMPDTHWVARVFNMAPSTARGLLRAVMSKHRRRIEAAIQREIHSFLEACTQDAAGGDWKVTWLNPVLVEVLNARLEAARQSKAAIKSSDAALGAWTVPNGSYEWLKENS